MDWKSNLRRTQSLKSVASPSCDVPIWTEKGLRDRKTSVSQLVARYQQTTVEVSRHIDTVSSTIRVESKLKSVPQETTPDSTTSASSSSPNAPSIQSECKPAEHRLDALLKRNDEKERPSTVVKTNLTRSISMGSLQHSAGGTGALRALFESKCDTPRPVAARAARPPSTTTTATPEDVKGGFEWNKDPPPPSEKREGGLTSAGATSIAMPDDAKANPKENGPTLKVVNKTRRRTIGGIDFEKLTASQSEDKRRSIADFRDSSIIQASSSVKSISALYLSKVAAAEQDSLLKPAQNHSSGSGKRVKMEEGPKRMKEDAPLPHREKAAGHVSGMPVQHSVPPQPSKEMFYQQRQKCELRRLLKHTHPELKTLDGVVDEDLADVLESLESGPTAAESGYEGEVLSRRWLFENMCNTEAPHATQTHMAEATAEGWDVRRMSAQNERIGEALEVHQSSINPNDCEEEMVRIDVQSARKMFESQCVDNFIPSPVSGTSQGKVVKKAKKQKKHSENNKTHMAEATVEGWDVRRTSAQNERTNEALEVHQSSINPNDCHVEPEEEMVRIDVQSARKMFESQCVDNFIPSLDSGTSQGKVVKKKHKKQKKHSENNSVSVENNDLVKQEARTPVVGSGLKPTFYENQEHNKGVAAVKPVSEDQSVSFPDSFGDSFEDTEGIEERVDLIRTSADLFQNNPFISTNMSKDKPHGTPRSPYGESAVDDNRASEAHVKNRTHLFESMPFHQIMHQNREEMETVVERINKTLNSLYHFNAIHSDGSVIEVHETMLATKARYMLSQTGPEIQYDDEVAEGGANNFILQLLPRANLKPQVIYLKEDKEGNVALMLVDVPVQQHQFNVKQENEVKTANAVQLIEDILYQDNSLRKGVIIQKDEVTVYSLYCYAEGDVKSYHPPPQVCTVEPSQLEMGAVVKGGTIETQEVRKGDVKSTISCLLANAQDQGCPVSIMPDANMKGNVKLFSSCIEKGDLEYLKTLQVEASEQESGPDLIQAPARDDTESCPRQEDQVEDPEWVPVDVKKLKNMFSADQRPVQPKPIVRIDSGHSAKLSQSYPGLEETHEKIETSYIDAESASDPCEAQQGTEVVQKGHLKAAIKSLQSAATELHQEDKEEIVHGNLQSALDSLERSSINVSKGDFRTAMIYRSSTQGNKDTCEMVCVHTPAETESKSVSCGDLTTEKQSSAGPDLASATCAEESQQGTEVVQKGHLKAAIKSLQSAATELHQEDKEEVVHGNLQAALDSLEKSSVNVSKGDFKAAMIYRGSSKSQKDTRKTADAKSAQTMSENKVGLLSAEPCETSDQLQQVENDPELCHLKAAICNLQQATNEAKELSKLHHISSAAKSSVEVVNVANVQAELTPSNVQNQCGAEEDQQGTEVVQKGHLKAAIKSLQSAATELHQEDKEEVVRGDLQSALDSLERSNINVSKGDFKAAMIYRGSSKTCKKVSAQNLAENKIEQLTKSKSDDQSSAVAEPPNPCQTPCVSATGHSSKTSKRSTAPKPVIAPKPAHLKPNHAINESTNMSLISSTTAEIKESKEEQTQQSLLTKTISYKEALAKGLSQTDHATESSPHVLDCDTNQPAVEAAQLSEEIQLTPSEGISGPSCLVNEATQNDSSKDNENAVEECPVDFQEARKKFGGGKNSQFKIPPVKPKRVKIAQNENKPPNHSSGPDNSTILTSTDAEPHIFTDLMFDNKPNNGDHTSSNNRSTDKDNSSQASNEGVVMREKKVKMETADERLQRLSVHMDEIMRGNMPVAMEIFDNMRKQEELKSILTKVEEIEEDTSNVDVSSLQSVFENVPEWVVTSQEKKAKQGTKVKRQVKTALPQHTESMSSMANVFGDLERASEEIMNLKEQTLARLVDIEGAIKKALSSVSNLKSDSDIAGLSGLFKESLGAVHPSTSGNISTISIGSTRAATSQTQESLTTQRVTAGLQVNQGLRSDVPGPKPHASPPTSPAFIEIQSAARKNETTQAVTPEAATCSPNTPEKFRTTKTMKCNAGGNQGNQGKKQGSKKHKHNKHNSKREVSVLEVQTDCDGNSVTVRHQN